MAESFTRSSHTWAHRSDLVLYARKVLGDQADSAEDVVQEAYLRLLALAANDDAPVSARPWLFRVVRNLAVDERRSATRRAVPTAELELVHSAHGDDPAAITERNHELAGTLAEVAALPDQERRVLEMDQAGIGAQRIAAELDTTPNAVHQALFRARRRLRHARAVAWGLVPVGAVPLALRMSDPAVAVSIANLPPGIPVGRALPIAAIATAGLVGGTVVAPSLDPTPDAQVPAILEATPAAAAAGVPGANPAARWSGGLTLVRQTDVDDDRSSSDRDAADDSANRGPKGGADDGDEDRSGRRDGDDSDEDRSGPGGGSDDDDDRSGSGGRDDDEDDGGDDRSGSGGGDEDDDERSGSSSGDSDDDEARRSSSSSSSGKRTTSAKKSTSKKTTAKRAKKTTQRVTTPPRAESDDDDDDDRSSSGSGSGSGSSSGSGSGEKESDSD